MYFSFIVTYIESKRGTWWNQTKLPRNGNYLVICQFIGTFKNLDIKFTRRNKYKSLIKRSILTHPSLWIQLQVPLDLITNPLVLAYQILDAIQKIMYATIYNKPLVLKHIWYDCKLFYSDWGFEPNYDARTWFDLNFDALYLLSVEMDLLIISYIHIMEEEWRCFLYSKPSNHVSHFVTNSCFSFIFLLTYGAFY